MKNVQYMLVAVLALAINHTFAETKKTEAKKIDESHIEYQKYRNAKAAKSDKTKSKKKSTTEVASASIEQPSAAASCQVQFEDFQDQRPNKESVGTNFAKSLTPVGIDAWLKDAGADLWIGKVKTAGNKTLVLKPKLDRLYTYAQSMNLHGVMAITVDFEIDGKVLESRKYRGLGSTTNAWNAEHEYYDSLSYAAHEAMPKVLKDISTVCAKIKS